MLYRVYRSASVPRLCPEATNDSSRRSIGRTKNRYGVASSATTGRAIAMTHLIVDLWVKNKKALQLIDFAGLFRHIWRREGDSNPR